MPTWTNESGPLGPGPPEVLLFQLPEPDFTGEEARNTADRVLSGRAYTQAARPPSLQERAIDWLGDLIADLFNALSSSGGRGAFAWVVIALFTGLILFLLSKLLRNLDPLPARVAAAEPEIGIVEGRTRAQWLEAAESARKQGDFRLAIRCHHRALVTSLSQQRIVDVRPGFTAGEICRATSASRPRTGSTMEQLTDAFDDAWYGGVPTDDAMLARFETLVSQVESTLDDSSAEPGVAADADGDRRPAGVS